MKNKFSFISAGLLAVFIFSGCSSLITDDTGRKQLLPEPTAGTELVYAGEVKLSRTNWNWLFQSSEEDRRDLLEKEALSEAVRLYGPEAVIRPELLSGKWNPASLLMFFGAAGFVEDAEITASVWLPAAEPQPAVKTGIRYVVVPASEYTSDAEFTTVTYKPFEELKAELEEAVKAGAITEEILKKRLSRLSGGGTVFITYGRTELTNAISRWFKFKLYHGGELILNKRGTEDMPYVYGNDKLWWNDKSYQIEQPWTDSLDLEIEDLFQNKIYNYKIIREVYVIPDSE